MENEEIDLVEVIAKLWCRKKAILCVMTLFLVVGLALAWLLPRKYTAECMLGLETEDRTTRIMVEGMSAFQSMNVGDIRDSKNISPAVYPDVLFSVPFQKELIYKPLYRDERGEEVTFYTYLTGKPVPSELSAARGVEQLTPEEQECLGYLKDAITVTVDNKNANLTISVDMPEAKMAAQVAYQSQVMLQRYISDFRIAKAKVALEFIDERYTEVKANLESKQQALVEFHQKNKGDNSIRRETEEKILVNDYELFFALYSDLVKQREKAKIQVKEDMPVLTVIEPVVEPHGPSKPQRALILLASLILGFFSGCAWVLAKPFFRQIREVKTRQFMTVHRAS